VQPGLPFLGPKERRQPRIGLLPQPFSDPRAALRTQIGEWQRTLAPEAREHGYLLEDIRKVIHATPQQLGLALHELGWHRKRVWLSDGPYSRRWYPPER
jgi:hypothetical protein